MADEEDLIGTDKLNENEVEDDEPNDDLNDQLNEDEDDNELLDDEDGKGKKKSKQPEAPKTPRASLKPREHKVDLESKLGKTVVISKATPSSQAGGYYCDVCDCVVKDSINYLDHINGKKHQRNLGMSMRVERSTLDDVKARFELMKRKREEEKKEYDIKERMKEWKEEEERLKEYKREKRKKKKAKHEQIDQGHDDEDAMAKAMGFASFGSSKK